ncbi:hypothetical protein BpHYR1_032816 [Brachionus plicatilis]|uniref:Uncharacterized protein n=1 Tax=Brachionus plicatilis TaxID=10195 RepID=A0A3M7SH96_BRAPC|nr:hypothetical protein BpHYR1_032816 [Brachionus plicatilis]
MAGKLDSCSKKDSKLASIKRLTIRAWFVSFVSTLKFRISAKLSTKLSNRMLFKSLKLVKDWPMCASILDSIRLSLKEIKLESINESRSSRLVGSSASFISPTKSGVSRLAATFLTIRSNRFRMMNTKLWFR